MSNKPGFFVQRTTDKKIIQVFNELCSQYKDYIMSISFTFGTNDTVSIKRDTGFTDIMNDDSLKQLSVDSSYIINKVSVICRNQNINYIRGELLTTPSAIFDYIEFFNSNNNVNGPESLTTEVKVKISKYLQSKLLSTATPKLISTNLPNEYEALLSQHNAMLEKLEDLNSELLIKSQEKIQQLDQSHFEKSEILENDFRNKTNKLSEKYDNKTEELENEYSSKKSELERLKGELDDRASQLDDRDNTHVRREIRDRMLDDVRARINDFGVSKATNDKRKPVLYGMILLIATFVCLIAYTSWEAITINKQTAYQLNAINNLTMMVNSDVEQPISKEILSKASVSNIDRSALYWIWIRLAVFSLGLIGSIIYYIKWQSKWADHHSNSEFHLQ
ncbi:hypothetical protein [uncultured Endozoicomonas sp.]|uniref:hypothetical protein n=1 Tax=uncultured Endozoicomonas sp. TaxID=432652 RepID=UPI002635A357|nr:hypothetical protein [uncultured Endozoicomonas sp.]